MRFFNKSIFCIVWLSSGASLEYSTVPFLPVDPDLSTMRNQGRQKLARLSPGEFSALVLDILHDADRRQLVNISQYNLKLILNIAGCFCNLI